MAEGDSEAGAWNKAPASGIEGPATTGRWVGALIHRCGALGTPQPQGHIGPGTAP